MPNSKFKNTLDLNGKKLSYYDLKAVSDQYNFDITKLPFSMRIVLENLVRNLGRASEEADIKAVANWANSGTVGEEIAYKPYRVLMQDFTGVPAVVDLASMRTAIEEMGGDSTKINPQSPVDLVIDHSVQVDKFGTNDALKNNVEIEMKRNAERYEFLKWGQQAFDNFKVVPPGTGICHQVNLEYLARVIAQEDDVVFPDTLVGTDSHTTMVNGLAVLGWGVGGIEAEASMLGQPISMLLPEVVGFKLTGNLSEGITATDLVLEVVQILRKHGVVGKFVEFYGDALDNLSLADRATIANMAPEYGATCGFFPIDNETLKYLHLTGREQDQIDLVEKYAKTNSFWRDGTEPNFSSSVSLDISTVKTNISGPKRPQDKILLDNAAKQFEVDAKKLSKTSKGEAKVKDADYSLNDGDIVVAAITSCTNTSNPYVMIASGLVAKKALEFGLKVKPWVKTSLAPGSQVVTEYLDKTGLTEPLDALGFNLVGYGCTTCIGNSGPLPSEISGAIKEGDLTVCSVLSGNRNFEGRIHQQIKANYLASPPLVVAYALAGSMNIDIVNESLGKSTEGKEIYLKDIWPSNQEISDEVAKAVTRDMFLEKYADVFKGDELWQDIDITPSKSYKWQESSTYVKNPPYFDDLKNQGKISDIKSARILGLFADSITTDHISPAGAIALNSPAADYLQANNVEQKDFNSYGSRRGNHEVMMRGTFANIRIKNTLVNGKEGGYTKLFLDGDTDGKETSIFEASSSYKQNNTSLVVIAGKEYGTGSSRDWAAKGTNLLGVKAVIAESFERIHRSNLVGMGVLPIEFDGISVKDLGLKGHELINIQGLNQGLKPKMKLTMVVDGKKEFPLKLRVDTQKEVDYIKAGGILQYVLLNLSK